MKKLSYLFYASIALVSLFAAIGLISTGPAFAQGQGQGGKPATDVRVINTAANAVPVHVGNNVPVTVTNPAPTPDVGTPVVIRGSIMISNGTFGGSAQVYVVPDGKVLRIDMATFHIDRLSSVGHHELTVSSLYEGVSVDTWIAPDGGSEVAEFGSEKIIHLAEPGSGVNIRINRTPMNNENIPLFGTVVLHGTLYNAPSE